MPSGRRNALSLAPLAVGLNAGDSRRKEVVFSPLHHDMYLRQLHTSLEKLTEPLSFAFVASASDTCSNGLRIDRL
jgi:hypothetical protein